MDARGFQNYRQQAINTMTPGELLMMLYDELVKRAMRAEIALDKQDYTVFEESVQRCQDIIRYLDDTLDRKYPIANELSRLYSFFNYDLGRIKIGRNKSELERIRPMLTDLRDTFRTVVGKSGS